MNYKFGFLVLMIMNLIIYDWEIFCYFFFYLNYSYLENFNEYVVFFVV